MAANEKTIQIFTKEEREKLGKKYLKEIKKALSGLDAEILKLNLHLMDECAHYAVALKEMNLMIERDGFMERYQNGENQWGTKKTVAAELKPKYTQMYQGLIKQLISLLPTESEKNAATELLEFLNNDKLA